MATITRRECLLRTGILVGVIAKPPLVERDFLRSIAPAESRALPGPPGVSVTPTPYQLQTPRQVLQIDVSATVWAERFTQLANQGYRPLWFQGSTNGGDAATYSAIWVRDGAPWFERHDMDASTYQSYFDSYASAGYRPICVSGYQSSGSNRLAAVWLYAPTVNFTGIHNATDSQYQSFVNNMAAANYRPQVVDGYALGNTDNYISIWADTAPVPWVARHGMTSEQYQSEFTMLASQGYRVTCLSAYQVNGVTYFAAYWLKDGVTDFIGAHDALPGTLFNQAIALEHNDYEPILIEGYDTGPTRNCAAVWIKKARSLTISGVYNPNFSPFDTAMTNFMQARRIRAGSLAVTKDSRLVYARGFLWEGYSEVAIGPDSLFRIASLTKPLTSMAILRLVQEGRLNLTDRLTALLGATMPSPLDSRMNSITVLHLLQHTGGWNRDITFDPMFYDEPIAAHYGVPLPISRQDIINYMTTTQSLSFAPGTQMNYSNYGYLLLGRIVEAVTGMTYGDYLKSNVLGRLGINRMVLGSTEFEYRKWNEAKCYTGDPNLHRNRRQPGAPVNAMAPYGSFNLENMDSHGGWLAGAVDLACFATAFDPTGLYPILNHASINQTFAVPSIGINADGSWYGCGWVVRTAGSGLNTWHNGSLPGTWTLMVRRYDGVNWVALFNQRDDPSGLSYNDIDPALHAAANAVTSWPTDDQFPYYALPLRSQAFTDDPLIAGVTPIKSVHLNELRARVDWIRSKLGLAPFSYAEPITPGAVVKAAHVSELRTALAAAYVAAGLPTPTYTDMVLTTGTSIKVVHVAELRSAVRAIE